MSLDSLTGSSVKELKSLTNLDLNAIKQNCSLYIELVRDADKCTSAPLPEKFHQSRRENDDREGGMVIAELLQRIDEVSHADKNTPTNLELFKALEGRLMAWHARRASSEELYTFVLRIQMLTGEDRPMLDKRSPHELRQSTDQDKMTVQAVQYLNGLLASIREKGGHQRLPEQVDLLELEDTQLSLALRRRIHGILASNNMTAERVEMLEVLRARVTALTAIHEELAVLQHLIFGLEESASEESEKHNQGFSTLTKVEDQPKHGEARRAEDSQGAEATASSMDMAVSEKSHPHCAAANPELVDGLSKLGCATSEQSAASPRISDENASLGNYRPPSCESVSNIDDEWSTLGRMERKINAALDLETELGESVMAPVVAPRKASPLCTYGECMSPTCARCRIVCEQILEYIDQRLKKPSS